MFHVNNWDAICFHCLCLICDTQTVTQVSMCIHCRCKISVRGSDLGSIGKTVQYVVKFVVSRVHLFRKVKYLVTYSSSTYRVTRKLVRYRVQMQCTHNMYLLNLLYLRCRKYNILNILRA